MKIYVSGASQEIERVERCMELLRAADYEITFDWCAALRAGVPDPARRCLGGVQRAEAFVLLAPAHGSYSVGAWIEVGAALALSLPILVSGSAYIWDALVTRVVARDALLFDALAVIAGHVREDAERAYQLDLADQDFADGERWLRNGDNDY